MGRSKTRLSGGGLGRLVAVAGVALITALAGPAGAIVVEKIAAVVGDEIILRSEVEDRAKPFMAEIAEITNQAQREARAAALRKEVLDRIIDEKLLEQQATEFKLSVSSEEIDRSIEQVKQVNKLSDADLQAALLQYGMNMAAYRKSIKGDLLRHKVVSIAVGSKVSVSESDVQAYYEKHYKSGGTNVEVRAAHVFISIPEKADTATVLEREKLARDVLARARAGEDFARLAKELSDDPATRNDGGDLGFFGKEMGLPRAVEDLVFAMKPGEVNGPVRGNQGFHVIKLIDLRAKETKGLAEVKEEIRMQLRAKEVERQTKMFLGELRKKTLVDVRL
jgi:peptidyl-prolyl cis-trans isomerase SurA